MRPLAQSRMRPPGNKVQGINPDHVLTLASINIERSKHLSRVFSFLEAVNPDVVCLQEVIEEDICAFRNRLHYQITSMHRCPGIQKTGETTHRDLAFSLAFPLSKLSKSVTLGKAPAMMWLTSPQCTASTVLTATFWCWSQLLLVVNRSPLPTRIFLGRRTDLPRNSNVRRVEA